MVCAMAGSPRCSLNGVVEGGACRCDQGWTGDRCARLDLAPANPQPSLHGLANTSTPTWGGTAVWEATTSRWHLIVGSRAVWKASDVATDYPCDSRIIRATSHGANPAGPYTIEEVLFPRSSWEPALTTTPGADGELVMLFFGNISNPPAVGSPACAIPSMQYNLTTTTTYVSVSRSGSPRGPWSAPMVVRGMENNNNRNSYGWSACSGNPSPAFHPNGTLFAAMRQNPCWKGQTTREHIGLWRADAGPFGQWTLVSENPLYGWGNGTEQNCTDANGCPSHEDPHLWIDRAGGFHLLTHDQNNKVIHSTRGAYGWSVDGHVWTLETDPLDSTSSAWAMDVLWTNGSTTPLARRQRPSLIRDRLTGVATHLLNGADWHLHLSNSGCEGCHWGQGFTLIQPLADHE